MTVEPENRLPTLEGALRALWDFWSRQGCLFLPPADFALPAGTLHPEMFFHLFGPDPWRAMLMQPVRRPLDARRGEHPFRFSQPLQLVILLKPAPADGQDLFVQSLSAVGIDPSRHDLRFVETAWSSRSLQVRGTGWSAQLDGLGVGRLTYHRQAAGRELDPPSFEITYGLERLLLLAHGGRDAGANPWSPQGATYGELRRQAEDEQARYVLEVAQAEFWHRRLAGLEEEARRCLDKGLPRTAYEMALRSLLGIDILATQGEITLRERDQRLEALQEPIAAAIALALGETLPDGEPPGETLDGSPEEISDGP